MEATYTIGKKLSEGTLGIVHECTNETGKLFVRKSLACRSKSSHSDLLRAEAKLLMDLHCENIIKVVGIEGEGKSFSVYLEHGGTTVIDALMQYSNWFEKLRYTTCVQLMQAVSYLHSRYIYHRDIKLENLLIDSRGWVRLADFHLSAVCTKPDVLLTHYCGSFGYVSPEVLKHNYLGAHADAWACGVSMFGIFFKIFPFSVAKTSDFRFQKAADHQAIHGPPGTTKALLDLYPSKTHLHTTFANTSESFIDLVDLLLSINPTTRLNIQAYMNRAHTLSNCTAHDSPCEHASKRFKRLPR